MPAGLLGQPQCKPGPALVPRTKCIHRDLKIKDNLVEDFKGTDIVGATNDPLLQSVILAVLHGTESARIPNAFKLGAAAGATAAGVVALAKLITEIAEAGRARSAHEVTVEERPVGEQRVKVKQGMKQAHALVLIQEVRDNAIQLVKPGLNGGLYDPRDALMVGLE